jgi:hypothetical protein
VPTSASTDVRQWARENGRDHGRARAAPQDVLGAYAAAHSGDGSQGETGPRQVGTGQGHPTGGGSAPGGSRRGAESLELPLQPRRVHHGGRHRLRPPRGQPGDRRRATRHGVVPPGTGCALPPRTCCWASLSVPPWQRWRRAAACAAHGELCRRPRPRGAPLGSGRRTSSSSRHCCPPVSCSAGRPWPARPSPWCPSASQPRPFTCSTTSSTPRPTGPIR